MSDTEFDAARGTGRLASLDALRGLTMFWLMGGKPFFLALAAVCGPVAGIIPYELEHSAWEGLRYYDLIWPCFMLMVGASIPFSFAKRSLTQSRGQIMRQVWKRAIVLFLLGSLRESISTRAPALIELSSALQPIGLAYLVAAHLAGCRARLQAAAGIFILAGYALLLALVPAPGIAAGSYVENHNLVTAVDRMILGRAHPEGWGTVLSAIPTISTTILGLLFGQLLVSARPRRQVLFIMGLTGLGCLAAGGVLSAVVPIVMKLWTSSYGLMSAGWASLLFLLLYWVVDVRGWRRRSFPLAVIGTNALAAYLGPTIVPVRSIVGIFTKPLAQGLGVFGPLLSAGAVLLVNWSVLLWMYRRKIFLKV